MKTGKLPGVVENRSVFMFTGAQGMEPAQLARGACAAPDGRFAVIATDQTGMFGNEQTMALRIGVLFDKVRAMLAVQGAEEAGEAFTVSLSLPQEAEETEIKKLSMLVAQEAKRRGIASYAVQVQGRYEMAENAQGQHGAAGGAGAAQLTITGVGLVQGNADGKDAQEPEIGTVLEGENLCVSQEGTTLENPEETKNTPDTGETEEQQMQPVKSVIMVGHAALEATAVLISEKRETLLGRLTTGYLTQGLEKASCTDMREAAKIAVQAGALVKTAGEGGVFGALWEIGEYFDCGMDIVLRDILLMQETIEVCEVLDVNPYLLTSRGCILAVTEDAEALLAEYREAGIAAAVIGTLKEGRDRVVHNEWEERFLEPFRGEELYQVL